jgi:inosine-uridine nucleoside N-ribohydrolase
MRRSLGTLLLLLLLQPVLPHYKARYHVVVDTDGGPDDIRAICLMLASPEIEIITITAVDGFLPPDQTVSKLQDLLAEFGHQGIPVGTDAGLMMTEALALEDMPVDIIALGPLTNLALLLEREPESPVLVRKVYWHNDAMEKRDVNYSHNPRSARKVLQSGLDMDRVDMGEDLISLEKHFPAGLDSLSSRCGMARMGRESDDI